MKTLLDKLDGQEASLILVGFLVMLALIQIAEYLYQRNKRKKQRQNTTSKTRQMNNDQYRRVKK